MKPFRLGFYESCKSLFAMSQGVTRLQYASGLMVHTHSCWRLSNYLRPVAKNLALLGNTGKPSAETTINFLRDVADKYENVYMVFGPEDLSGKGSSANSFYDNIQKFREIRTQYNLKNLHYVTNCTTFRVGDLTIVGNTLWSTSYCNEEHSKMNLFPGVELDHCKLEAWAEEDEEDLIDTLHSCGETPIIVLTYSLCSSNLFGEKALAASRSCRNTWLHPMVKPHYIKTWLCGASPSSVTSMEYNTFIGVNNFNAPNYCSDAFVEIDTTAQPPPPQAASDRFQKNPLKCANISQLLY